jgi:ferredoxin
MQIDPKRCVGCGNCVPVCTMGAIHVENRIGYINQDACVECGACIRFVTPEDANPGFVRFVRRTFAALHLRYDQPLDMCPTRALYQPELKWPRSLRSTFSDPTTTHSGTGVKGRGTEEIKTNDVTGRLQPGWAGVLVEFGRPGTGARFHEVQRMTRTLAAAGVRFEPKNPITQLMVDEGQGLLNEEVLDEKVLSCILEVLVPVDRVVEVLDRIAEVARTLDTVISIDVNGRCGPNGEIPYEERLADSPYRLSPNGKQNLGLGRAFEREGDPAPTEPAALQR